MSFGYLWLIEHFKLECLGPHQSEIAPSVRKVREEAARKHREHLPSENDPDKTPVDHLVFALKYDGVALSVLAAVFAAMGGQPLVKAIETQGPDKYLRQLWFFYEWLMDARLELPDLHQGNYVDALDPDRYFVVPGRRSSRHRVRNNLLGTRTWCPVVRRTQRLKSLVAEPLAERMLQIVRRPDSELLRCAVQYLHTKVSDKRFVALLQRAAQIGALDRDVLIELQHEIVEPVCFGGNYRSGDIYVGQTRKTRQPREDVHYIAPRPEVILEMMGGFLELARRIIVAPAYSAG